MDRAPRKDPEGRALLVHRSPRRRWYPDVWDLPGGHVEPGEKPTEALERELAEELGITASVTGERLARVHASDFRMDAWVVDRWAGEPVNRAVEEHDALAWVDAAEVASLRVAHPRLPALVAAALARPATWRRSPRRATAGRGRQ